MIRAFFNLRKPAFSRALLATIIGYAIALWAIGLFEFLAAIIAYAIALWAIGLLK